MKQSISLKAALGLALGFAFVPWASATDYYISISEFGDFDPSYLEVHLGDTVYWGNDDYFSPYRTTICASYPWNSGHIPPGFAAYLTVTKTGTFDYYASYYSVYGTLVVKANTPVNPPPVVLLNPQLVAGSFQCTVSNLTVGQPYYIQSSTNLVDWADTFSSTASSDIETYADSSAASLPRLFYRCYQQPYIP